MTGVNEISINNALNAPLCYLKLSLTSNTIIPDTNELKIYVTKDADNKKTYSFNLSNPLSINDTFIIEPIIKNNSYEMICYISNESKTYLEYIPINLFQGTNIIKTNYENINIELIYLDDNDNNKKYSSIAILNETDKKIIDFVNPFTKTSNGLNLDINNLNVGCITNSDNKFSIDSNGNITANSISLTNDTIINYNDIFDKIYPVGSICISVNNINPSTIFTGTWERFAQGRTLVGVNESETEFNSVLKTGGSKYLQSHTHSATSNYTGAHQHTGNTLEVAMKTSNNSRDCVRNINSTYDNAGVTITNSAGGHSHTITISAAGSGSSGNLQPYITCYIWKRTA